MMVFIVSMIGVVGVNEGRLANVNKQLIYYSGGAKMLL